MPGKMEMCSSRVHYMAKALMGLKSRSPVPAQMDVKLLVRQCSVDCLRVFISFCGHEDGSTLLPAKQILYPHTLEYGYI